MESEPKRVVTVGYTDQDATLAVGVVPVGVGDFLGGYEWRERPWAQDALKGAEPEVVSGQEINFEAVAAQRPDLIIAINAGLKQADYDKLSQLAPTVAQSGDYIDFGMPWDEQTLLVGKALGREDAPSRSSPTSTRASSASAPITRVRRQDRHPRLRRPGGLRRLRHRGHPQPLPRRPRLQDPEKVDELAGESFFAQFSQEQFRLMDQDLVVMYGAEKDILANPVFKRLDAVKEDRVIYLDLTDQFAGALGFASALSLPYLMDEAEESLTNAVDGDPATAVAQPD